MARAQLHEVLAVEQDLKGKSNKILVETQQVFGRPEAFSGSITTFDPFSDNEAHLKEEKREELVTTVEDRLRYTARELAQYWDAVAQKEATNQSAKADIVVDGAVLCTDVPATMLLGLETKLTQFRQAISVMPTLDAKVSWDKADDVRKNAWRATHPTSTFRTRKVTKAVVLSEAVIKDGIGLPAQIKEVTEDVAWGRVTKWTFSGAVSAARASEILGRVDKLLRAVKAARQRANKQEVVDIHVGQTLLNYALGSDTLES